MCQTVNFIASTRFTMYSPQLPTNYWSHFDSQIFVVRYTALSRAWLICCSSLFLLFVVSFLSYFHCTNARLTNTTMLVCISFYIHTYPMHDVCTMYIDSPVLMTGCVAFDCMCVCTMWMYKCMRTLFFSSFALLRVVCVRVIYWIF